MLSPDFITYSHFLFLCWTAQLRLILIAAEYTEITSEVTSYLPQVEFTHVGQGPYGLKLRHHVIFELGDNRLKLRLAPDRCEVFVADVQLPGKTPATIGRLLSCPRISGT